MNPFYTKSSDKNLVPVEILKVVIAKKPFNLNKIAGGLDMDYLTPGLERKYYGTTVKDQVSELFIPEYEMTYRVGDYLDTGRSYFKILGLKEDSSDIGRSVFELQEYEPFVGEMVGAPFSQTLFQIDRYEIKDEAEMQSIKDAAMAAQQRHAPQEDVGAKEQEKAERLRRQKSKKKERSLRDKALREKMRGGVKRR